MPTLNKLHEKYASQGLVVIGLHSDKGTDDGVKAVAQEKMKYAVAFDDGKLFQEIGANGYPTMVLIDKKGVIRSGDVYGEDLDPIVEALLKE